MLTFSNTSRANAICCFVFVALSASLWLRSGWVAAMIRVSLYLILPILIYLNIEPSPTWIDTFGFNLFIGLLFIIGVSSILILKFTRRRKGFRPTPTDYLIVLFAIVLIILSRQQQFNDLVGFWGTFLLLFFFSAEVLLGEVRGEVI